MLRATAAAGLAITAIVAPWLVFTAAVHGPTATLVFGCVALVAAFHGWGVLVARLARQTHVAATLLVQWGIAAVIALGGVMIAVGHYDPHLLVVGGVVVHTARLAIAFSRHRDDVGAALVWSRFRLWSLPIALLCVLALVHVLAGAGSIADRPFDDDGNLFAQVARLHDTGGLDDALGFPRITQLGGRLAIDGLVTAFEGPRAIGLVDGIALALALCLVLGRLGLRDAASSIWGALLVVTASAMTVVWPDRLPLWLPVGLVAAAVFTLEDQRPGLRGLVPSALLAAALIVVRTELAPAGLTFAVAAWWRSREPERRSLAGLACVASVVVAVVGAYALARLQAWHALAPAAHALVEPHRGSAIVRLLLAVVVAAAVAPLLLVVLPKDAEARTLRWIAYAVATTVGGMASALTSERTYGPRMLWPVAIAAVVVVLVHVARQRVLDRLAFALIVLFALVGWEGRQAPRRTGWAWRYYELMFDAEYARHASPEGGSYEQLLAQVPRGERVAIWVTRPELVDYARHVVIDLRSTRVGRLRTPTEDSRLARVVAASKARWLLVEDDAAAQARARGNAILVALCAGQGRTPSACSDSLDRVVASHPTVAAADGVRLISLGPGVE